MGDVTNRQHYVFQAYLKRWIGLTGEKLWCLKKSEKRVFPSSTYDVLNKRQMYKIQEMNDDEKKFFELVMTVMKLTNGDKSEMRKHIDEYLLPFIDKQLVEALKESNPVPENHPLNDELESDFKNLDEMIQKQIVNTEEGFYGDYEGDAVQWINSIIDGNTDFYYKGFKEDSKTKGGIEFSVHYERDDFLNFLCIQYFRTVGMRNVVLDNIQNMLKIAEEYKEKGENEDLKNIDLSFNEDNIRPKSILPHLIWIMQTRCSAALGGMNADLQLLRNETDLPFITSDQPVINIKAEVGEKVPEELVLYYPLSPKVAVIINGGKGEKRIEKKHEIDKYNKMIFDHSFEYVIADRKEVLEGMIDMYM